jgi:hypothetical protein
MKVQYFDKSFPLIAVIDLSPLSKSDQEAVANYLTTKYQAWPVTYPSDTAKATTEELANRGFRKFLDKPPYILTTDEAIMLFIKCLEKFNPIYALRSTPNTLRLQKTVTGEKDFVRVVDELTIQQDSITISNLWKLPEMPRIAFTNRKHPINERLCRTLIVMPDEFIGKRKFDDKMVDLDRSIDSAIESDKVQSQANHTEGKYRL